MKDDSCERPYGVMEGCGVQPSPLVKKTSVVLRHDGLVRAVPELEALAQPDGTVVEAAQHVL